MGFDTDTDTDTSAANAGADNFWADLDTPASEAALMGEPEPGGGAGADDGGGENADNPGDGAGSEGSGAEGDGGSANGENSDGGSGADDLDLGLLSAIAEDDDTQQRRDPVIPRARFDEVNHARREAEARAAELEAEVARLAAERAAPQQGQGQAQPGQTADSAGAGGDGDAKGAEPFDFDAKEREYLDAQWEGDQERALAVRREINEAIRKQAADDASREAVRKAEAITAAKEAARIAQEQERAAKDAADAAASRLSMLFENDGNNQAMADFVEWRDFYRAARGMTAAEAITAATDRVAAQYAQPAKASPGTTPALADPTPDQRTQKAIARGAETSSRQPPPLGESGAGNRTAPPIPKIETQEDWDKLPEKERERLLMQGV